MIGLNDANVGTILTDTGIQRRSRSILTSDRAAAEMQPTIVRPWHRLRGPSRASLASHRDRQV
ncbi:hypothetical protein Adi01nite_76900 [Amorphoplanes digitatis]|nr:hypothetical protein Adi01nite_76900 [Actinoplanes digitatis]